MPRQNGEGDGVPVFLAVHAARVVLRQQPEEIVALHSLYEAHENSQPFSTTPT